MEKRAVVAKGWTPPEKDEKDLSEHPTKRLAERVQTTKIANARSKAARSAAK